jgi:hypothetical protein
MVMAQQISPHALQGLLEGTARLARIDASTRRAHQGPQPDASGTPRRQRAFRMVTAVLVPHVRIVLYDGR